MYGRLKWLNGLLFLFAVTDELAYQHSLKRKLLADCNVRMAFPLHLNEYWRQNIDYIEEWFLTVFHGIFTCIQYIFIIYLYVTDCFDSSFSVSGRVACGVTR